MGTELQVCGRDLLKAFCEDYISQNAGNWPRDETDLASAFVKYFRLPPLAQVRDFEGFTAQANIELIEDNLPSDLLGLNISFGDKRKIFFSGHADHLLFQVHTVLHETREIIEDIFCRLGFTTAGSGNLETRADQFAFAAFICAGGNMLREWFEDALEIESKWRKLAALGLICLGAATLILYSFMGAFSPRVAGHPVKSRL